MEAAGRGGHLAIAVAECAAGPLSRDLVRRRLMVRPGESEAYHECLTAAIGLCRQDPSMEVALVASLVGVAAGLATYLGSKLGCEPTDIIDAIDGAMSEQGVSI